MWAQRNANEHGKGYSISLIEKERVGGQIEQIYEFLLQEVESSDMWLFQKSLEERMRDKYDVQIAWLQTIRKLYTYHEYDWYNDDRRSERHVEYVEDNLFGRSLQLW